MLAKTIISVYIRIRCSTIEQRLDFSATIDSCDAWLQGRAVACPEVSNNALRRKYTPSSQNS